MGSNRNDKMSGINRKTYLRDVNPYLICPLCRGYLIDATTVVECLHSFCRSCILKHLQNEAHCPSCKDILNKVKPNIKADKALQDIVYKLVPGLYHKEMRRRKEFYMKHPEHAESATPEQRGEDAASSRLFFAPEDAVSLSLEYLPLGVDPIDADSTYSNADTKKHNAGTNRRYLQCPALVTIAHLKKFLALKYNVDITRYNIDICHRRAPLPEYLTLMDVAYIYAWKRNAPMRFFYMITQEEQLLEAPPNDRPSTPGLGATFPPVDEREIISQNEGVTVTLDIEEKNKDSTSEKNMIHEKSEPLDNPNQSLTERENVEHSLVRQEESTKKAISENTDEKPCKSEKIDVVVKKEINDEEKDETKAVTDLTTKVKFIKETSTNESLVNKIKSPIKILKNSDGSYAVKSSSDGGKNEVQNNTVNAEVKSEKAEFSIVSFNNGSNSNGVKMTLKQCSPGNIGSKKPKVISNVLLRSPGDKSISIVQQIKEANKNNTNSNLNKEDIKAPVSELINKETTEVTEKTDKIKRKVSFSDESMEPEMKKTKYSDEQKIKKEFLQSFELAATEDCKSRPPSETKTNAKICKKEQITKSNISAEVAKSKETATETSSTSNKNMDVYTFPNESPPIAGAVKRRCPPGLVITDMAIKNSVMNQSTKRGKTNYINTPKSYRKMMKEAKPSQMPSTSDSQSIVDTRNLLDECGLNIPAGLSITLASSKPRTNHNYVPESSTSMKLAIKSSDKLNQSIVEVQKPKNSFVKPPAPDIIPISSRDISSKNRSFKSESQDVLDLSNSRTPEFLPPRGHRLPKVPLPVIKPRSVNNQTVLPKKGQVVTLMGGQKYYRAPPGSLTPAAHRVTEFSTPPSGRAPVYAPNLLGSSNNNFSSAFPTLQFYVQYQRDRLKYTPQENPTKTHLMTQCPPVKPTRSSLVVPKQQPSNDHLYIKKVLANDARMTSTKHVTFDKPCSIPQAPTTNATVGSSAYLKDTSSPSYADRSTTSPRVSSTVSPSPSPTSTISDSTNDVKTSDKSPESPDSSSVVENKSSEKKDKGEQDKADQKQAEDNIQKQLLASFPSKEWASNTVISQEHLDKLIKNLKSRVENKDTERHSEEKTTPQKQSESSEHKTS